MSLVFHSASGEGIKKPLTARFKALPVWSTFHRTESCESLFLFYLNLTNTIYLHLASLWMVMPGGTASQGNANKRRADSEASVFNNNL